jgi:SRS2
MDMNVRNALRMIDAATGCISTEEQLEFAADFTKPMCSFANPGTGKSHSLINGLIMAQTYHKVPGRKINAMSFTKDATYELKARYDKACKKCGITPTVTFNTFHSICREIVLNRFPDMEIKGGIDWENDLNALQQYMKQRGIDTEDMQYVKNVILAITEMNTKLCYAEDNVLSKFTFKKLDMPIEIFQQLRSDMFGYGVITKKIPQGDIPTYALYVLALDEKLQQKYRDKYKIMVVDEFQDMSKLYLTILSMISSNLIVIGDMKQQIYGFNGACAEIVQEYIKMFPNAKKVALTQSFRCKNEIARYATKVYWPNDKSVVPFLGTGNGAKIKVCKDEELPLHDIVENIKREFNKEDVGHARQTMFLFRNNFSITPIAEELYQQEVPFRVKKFYRVQDYPIFRDLCVLGLLAMEPDNEVYQKFAIRLFPEFKQYQDWNNPFLKAFNGKSIFSKEYRFRESSSIDFMNALKKAKEYIADGRSASVVLGCFWGIYEEYIIEHKWWLLEHERDFYLDLVRGIVETKTFPRMISEENEKLGKVQQANNALMGIKCYTMHSAKGLEADDVYILDADEGIIPSKKNLDKLLRAGCDYEAARMVREERNLLYVAITRAKENVVITYYKDLTQLIKSPENNDYSDLDSEYENVHADYDEVGAFLRIINLDVDVDVKRSGKETEVSSL